jgi:fructokinase
MAVTPAELVRVAPGSDVQAVDPVGAGDAFASVVLLGLLHDWPLKTALERAQHFASRIVGRQGATVDDPAFYAEFSEAWGRA